MKFCGELSQNCKKFIIKKTRVHTLIVMYVVCLLFSISFIVLTFIYNWIFIMAVITLLLLPLLSLLTPAKSILDLTMPQQVVINKDEIKSVGEKFNYQNDIEQIKKINDYGDWYQTFFYFPHKYQTFICQKDLIVEGTIDEFEETFKDKIVRKIIKSKT